MIFCHASHLKMFVKITSVLFASLALAQALPSSKFTCPEGVETVAEFYPDKYLGEWYTTYSNINFFNQEGDNCIQASYKPLSKSLSKQKLNILFKTFVIPLLCRRNCCLCQKCWIYPRRRIRTNLWNWLPSGPCWSSWKAEGGLWSWKAW